MPVCVMAGVVSVGDWDTFGDEPAVGSIAFASPKSSTFTVPSARHLDVRGLEIAMDDPLLVRRLERFGDLFRDQERLINRDRSTRDPLREVLALNQFHHERADSVTMFKAVDVGDVIRAGPHPGPNYCRVSCFRRPDSGNGIPLLSTTPRDPRPVQWLGYTVAGDPSRS